MNKKRFRSDHNYYVHEEGAMDYRQAAGSIKEEAEDLRQELRGTQERVDDKRLRWRRCCWMKSKTCRTRKRTPRR